MYELLSFLVEAEPEVRGLDPNIVRPGWGALGLVTLLGVIVYLLCRSMAKQSRKAREPWPGDAPEDEFLDHGFPVAERPDPASRR